MGKKVNPRHGSMQFWPRKRARGKLAKVRSYGQTKLLSQFVGYKVGMAHVISQEKVGKRFVNHSTPVTILECPSLKIYSARFYKNKSVKTEVLSKSPDKELKRKVKTPKKQDKTIDSVSDDFDNIRIVVYTQPKNAGVNYKTPELFEIPLGGKKEDQLNWVKENMEKEINVNDVLNENDSVDAHAITKGKGFQGVIKRFGVKLRPIKSEKGQRRVGARSGGWYGDAHMMYRVPQPGKMGCHIRTEYNKKLLKLDDNPDNVNLQKGIKHYGKVKSPYILLKGSVPGSVKRPVRLNSSIRPNKKVNNENIEIQKVVE